MTSNRSIEMIRKFGFVSAAVVAIYIAGCQQAISKTPDAATGADSKAAAEEKKGVDIGDQGPAWENLVGTDDKQHSLKDLEKSKAVAIVFTCNTCPVAQAYEDRLAKLATDYKDKGV